MESTEGPPKVDLEPVYVIPGYTFFYWGFTIPKRRYSEYANYFNIGQDKLVAPLTLEIKGHRYKAKIRVARITTPRFPNRNVIQVYYENELETLKALRKMFIYSYAATINKAKSDLKELSEFAHLRDNVFRVTPVSKQRTDFDEMFNFLEDKNLFDYWESYKKGGKNESFFIDFSRKWIPAKDLGNYENRNNVIYLLYHSKNKQLYVGKANKLDARVKSGVGRIGLANDWDKFMFFEINPEYNAFIEQIEAFLIRTFGSLLENDVGMTPLNERNVKLVNRQLINRVVVPKRRKPLAKPEQATLVDQDETR